MLVIICFFLGLLCGSFVNALVWRLHKQETARSKVAKQKLSIVHGRSMCTSCKHQLTGLDLIPVFSWVFLKGRCRYCKHPISTQYPLIELLTGALFAASYLFWPGDLSSTGALQFGLWLVILTGLVALVIYDIKWMLLPNRIVFPLFVFALLYALLGVPSGDVVQNIYELLLSVVIGGGLFFLLFQISDGRWIGGGDVKLGVVLGLLLGGPYLAFLMILLASLLGTLFILPGLALKVITAQSKIPFGPFLIASAYLILLFGTGATDAYLDWVYLGR